VRLKEKDCRIGCGGRLFPPPHDWRTQRRLTHRHMAEKGAVNSVALDPVRALAGRLIKAALPRRSSRIG
jgi:hypothetical protein